MIMTTPQAPMTTPSVSDSSDEMVNLLDVASAALSASIVASDQVTSLARQRDAQNTMADSSNNSVVVEDLPNAMNIRLKDDGSFVTDADLAAQFIIAQSLHNVSTGIRLVGEESEEEMTQRAITGHEERAHQIFLLAQEEINFRYTRALATTTSDTTTEQHPNHDTFSSSSSSFSSSLRPSTSMPLAQVSHGSSATKDYGDDIGGSDQNEEPSTMTATLPSRPPLKDYIVEASRVSVFIDPLDGTKAYTSGNYDPVSILIAVILDKSPCFGVICKPFGYPNQPSVLDTGCVVFYGGTLLGGAFTAGREHSNFLAPIKLQAPPPGPIETSSSSSSITPSSPSSTLQHVENNLPRAVISSSRSQGIVEEFVTHLGSKGMINPTPLMITGAGEKSLRIVLRAENEGLWFFPKPGTSLWDVAASDALLRATGGRLTDKNGNEMDYSKSRLQAENEDGVVACYDYSLHTECIKLYLEGTWTKS